MRLSLENEKIQNCYCLLQIHLADNCHEECTTKWPQSCAYRIYTYGLILPANSPLTGP